MDDARMVHRIIRLAIGLIILTYWLVRWTRARTARMRQNREEDVYARLTHASVTDRFRSASADVREEARQRQSAEVFAIDDGDLIGEMALLEEAAQPSGQREPDYALRSEPAADFRRRLGFVVFILTSMTAWFILDRLYGQTRLDPAMKLVATGASMIPVVAITGFAGSKIGAWFGINPYEPGFRLAQKGKWSRALKYLQLAVDRRPDSIRARYALAVVLKARGRLDEAIRHIGELDRITNGSPIASATRGDIEIWRDNIDAARIAYTRAAATARALGAPLYAQSVDECVQLLDEDDWDADDEPDGAPDG